MASYMPPFPPVHLGRHSKRLIALAIAGAVSAVFWAILLWPVARFAKHHF